MDVKQYYGPGYWAAIHIDAFNSHTYEKKITSANTIARLISTFPCLKCRTHGIEYAAHNPFIYAINDIDELSLFKWTVRFHNAVNSRIGKPTIGLEESVKKWGDEALCMGSSCIDDED
jgi:hypothetical protein